MVKRKNLSCFAAVALALTFLGVTLAGCGSGLLDTEDDVRITYMETTARTLSGAYEYTASAEYTLSLGNNSFSSAVVNDTKDATATEPVDVTKYFTIKLYADADETEPTIADLVDTYQLIAYAPISGSSATLTLFLTFKDAATAGAVDATTGKIADSTGHIVFRARASATANSDAVTCITNTGAIYTVTTAGISLENVVLSGTGSTTINTAIKLHLNGIFSFNKLAAGSVVGTINDGSNSGAGSEVSVLYDVAAGATEATVVYNGTGSTSVDGQKVKLAIRKSVLQQKDLTEDVNTDENDDAVWNIASDAAYAVVKASISGSGNSRPYGFNSGHLYESDMVATTAKDAPYYIEVALKNTTFSKAIAVGEDVASWIVNAPSGSKVTFYSSSENAYEADRRVLQSGDTIAILCVTPPTDAISELAYVDVAVPADCVASGTGMYATCEKFRFQVAPTIKVDKAYTITTTAGGTVNITLADGYTFAKASGSAEGIGFKDALFATNRTGTNKDSWPAITGCTWTATVGQNTAVVTIPAFDDGSTDKSKGLYLMLKLDEGSIQTADGSAVKCIPTTAGTGGSTSSIQYN